MHICPYSDACVYESRLIFDKLSISRRYEFSELNDIRFNSKQMFDINFA